LPAAKQTNQLLINAQLPSDQAEACSADVIELRDELEQLLQRNWTQHPRLDTAPRAAMWGASTAIAANAPPRRTPRSLIVKPHCVPPKLAHQLHHAKATESCRKLKVGVSYIRPGRSVLWPEYVPTHIAGDPKPRSSSFYMPPEKQATIWPMALADTPDNCGCFSDCGGRATSQ
jgi:hypothetical protein